MFKRNVDGLGLMIKRRQRLRIYEFWRLNASINVESFELAT